MRSPLLALAPLAALLAMGGCHKPAPTTDAASQARAVSVTRVAMTPIAGAVSASGDLTPREEAAVLPVATGYRVARVLTDVGAYVRQGQALIELDPGLVQAQLEQQRAQATQADVQARQAEAEAARVKGLDGLGVLSQEQIDQRRFQARAARANAQALAAALRDTRSRLSVTAPVSGLVLERNVRPGDLSASGGSPWFRLAKDGQVELQAQLSEADLAFVRPGQRVTVTLQSGAAVPGRVRLVSPAVDSQTKLGFVRIQLPVRSDVRAGGFARAIFGEASAPAVSVPETAVRYDADGASVLVVDARNRVRRVAVQAGQRGGGLVQLLKGPPAGTLVVRSSGAFLLDGDLVRPVAEATVPSRTAGPR